MRSMAWTGSPESILPLVSPYLLPSTDIVDP